MEIYKKLHALQSEVGAIAKTEPNPFFKSKYFDINALIQHLSPYLQKHGLVIIQPLTTVDGKPAIETIIHDADGDGEIRSTVILPNIEDPQKMGSAITYFRRYALTSFLLVQGEKDDDGNAAKPTKATSQVTTEPITAEQFSAIDDLLVRHSIDVPAFMGYYKIKDLNGLTKEKADSIIQTLKKKYE